MWDQTFELRARNASLAPGEAKWTLERISKETGIPKSTLGHLYGNAFAKLTSNMFIGLDSLQELTLTSNQISSIEARSFNGLSNLKTLYLFGNAFAKLTSNMFIGLDSLQELILTSNQISSIEARSFNGLSNLEKLWLDSNNLAIICVLTSNRSMFIGLDSLQELTLASNQISSIEARSFNGLSNLEKLSLSSNQISSIESSILQWTV